MPQNSKPSSTEIRITVDGAEFYAFVRALKRSYHASDLGEVVLSVRGSKLVIETARGGSELRCNDAPPVTARLLGGRFLRLASLVKNDKATGPLVVVFRPAFGEVSLPHTGEKARFD